MRASRVLTVSLLLPGLAACMDDVDDRAIVDELRVLAVKAEPPEAPPGTSVALDALVADPFGGGRPLTLMWGLCAPDPVEGIAGCTSSGGVTPFGEGASASLALPESSLDGLDAVEAARGIDIYVVLHASAPEAAGTPAATVVAYKRVRVSRAEAANRNPSLVALLADGRETLVADGEERLLQALLAEGSVETYVDALGEERAEEIKYTWLATGGTWSSPLTFGDPATGLGENDWTAPQDEPADVWVLARDPRGGVDWIHRLAREIDKTDVYRSDFRIVDISRTDYSRTP